MSDADRGRRPFTVADGMIVVAGAALLVAWLRGDYRFWSTWRHAFRYIDQYIPWAEWIVDRLEFFSPRVLSAATMAWLVLRLRRPRPQLRRLARRPGWTACAAAGMLIVPTLLISHGLAVTTYLRRHAMPIYWDDGLTLPIGAAVAGAWSSLVWRVRWGAEAHWLDRTGRLIGAGWIALLVVGLILHIGRSFDPGWLFSGL